MTQFYKTASQNFKAIMVNVKVENHQITFVPRLLEMSNDVEKNPGPPKVIKNGLIPPGSSSKDKSSKMSEKSDKQNGGTATKATPAVAVATVDDGLMPAASGDLDSLRQVLFLNFLHERAKKLDLFHFKQL